MNQESLLPLDTPLQNNNQYFTKDNNNIENSMTIAGKSRLWLVIILITVLSALISGFILLIMFNPTSGGILPYAVVILFAAPLWISIICGITKRIQFTKNTYLNQLIIKRTTLWGCSKKYTLMLDNVYVLCQRYRDNNTHIIVINTLRNPKEIDLDKSTIKKSPINIIYELNGTNGYNGNYYELQLKFDNFLGQQKYENLIYEEIDKYSRLYNKNFPYQKINIVDNYMKISDHFYTFFNDILYKNKRVDFIYSNDFESLFIGEVNGSKYKKTLLVNLNQINSFEKRVVVKGGSESNDYIYYLKINYKDSRKDEIRMGKDRIERYVEKFVLLMNGKLNDINEMKKNNNDNYTPQ